MNEPNRTKPNPTQLSDDDDDDDDDYIYNVLKSTLMSLVSKIRNFC